MRAGCGPKSQERLFKPSTVAKRVCTEPETLLRNQTSLQTIVHLITQVPDSGGQYQTGGQLTLRVVYLLLIQQHSAPHCVAP